PRAVAARPGAARPGRREADPDPPEGPRQPRPRRLRPPARLPAPPLSPPAHAPFTRSSRPPLAGLPTIDPTPGRRSLPMRPRPFPAACLLLGACGGLSLALVNEPAPRSAPVARSTAPRVLPGVQPGGVVRLPNQWCLRPAGKQLPLGDFPVN